MVASTDVRGNRAVFAHDAQGRIVKQTITDAATSYAYDGQDRLIVAS